jgi:hypothetical protein
MINFQWTARRPITQSLVGPHRTPLLKDPAHREPFLVAAVEIQVERVLKQAEAVEDLIEIHIEEGCPTKIVRVGVLLIDEIRGQLQDFLKQNRDVFAWTYEDILGIDLEIMVHR